MNAQSNRNILFAVIAAVIVAAVTAAVLFATQCGESDDNAESVGGSLSVARRIMTPAPVDQGKADAAKDRVVASVTSKGRGQVIVVVAANLSPNASAQDQAAAVASAQNNVLASVSGSVNVMARATRVPLMLVDVDTAAARSLAASSSVVALQENVAHEPTVDDTIPLIGAPEAYAAGYSGKGQTVAILDTGTDTSHHFFADRVLAEACFSGAWDFDNGDRSVSLCPSGENVEVGPGAAANCQVDWCVHGTHVTGIAAGNGSGGSGVAKDAGIVAVNIFVAFESCQAEENCIRTMSWDYIAALEWVLENKDQYNIAAVNMSIGGGRYSDEATCDADNQGTKVVFDALAAANVAVLVASGNDGYTDSIGSPGCVSSAIAVGSTTKSDGISDFSNSSSLVEVIAPGSDIVSAAPGGGWASLSGTSMATPHVAGAFTVLRAARPEASVSEILTAVVEGGVSLRDSRNGVTRSRLQLDGALNALVGGRLPQPTPGPKPQPVPGGAPANDDQDNPVVIDSANFRHQMDVRQATMGDDPVINPTWYCPEGGRFDKSVWYSFTAPTNGYLTVSTQGSTYDTIVSVWQGSRGAPYQIGCSDDDAYPNTLTTTIAGWVAAGTTFRIQVAAWDNGGSLNFQARFQSSNASSVYTDPNVAPVVFDGNLSEAPSDLAVSRPGGAPQASARCEAKGNRPADVKGECYTGPGPR